MQENITQLLEENLRDVQLPEPISWWPLAPAWWVLAAAVLVALGWLILLLLRFKRQNHYKKVAKLALEQHFQQWQTNNSASEYAQAANQVLRRCVLHLTKTQAKHRSLNVGVAGKEWAKTLTLITEKKHSNTLSQTSLDALTERCYHANPDIDVPSLHRELIRWVRNHKPRIRYSSASQAGQIQLQTDSNNKGRQHA